MLKGICYEGIHKYIEQEIYYGELDHTDNSYSGFGLKSDIFNGEDKKCRI